jgi:hypothetical protein
MKAKDIEAIIKKQGDILKYQLRKVVTGDENKRVRDHIREKKEKPKYIILMDKIYFTVGVMNIPICQYFLTARPDLFWLWYTICLISLMIARFIYFKQQKYHYFLLDFCYYTQLLTFLCLYVIKSSPWFFKICFIFSNGPLMTAIIVWRCSIVFHDFDKLTSIYIHILPSMLMYAMRWHTLGSEMIEDLTFSDYVRAAIGYIIWQITYYVKTEVLDKDHLDGDPEILTSLRWLATDKNNTFARTILKLLKAIHVVGENEDYNPYETKTKVIFILSQFIYTLFTFLPTPIYYNNQHAHLWFIVIMFVVSVYNGASFYIEVFSKRYQLQFIQKNEIQQVAGAAAKVVIEAVNLHNKSHNNVSSETNPDNNFVSTSCNTTNTSDCNYTSNISERSEIAFSSDSISINNEKSIQNIIDLATTQFMDDYAEARNRTDSNSQSSGMFYPSSSVLDDDNGDENENVAIGDGNLFKVEDVSSVQENKKND